MVKRSNWSAVLVVFVLAVVMAVALAACGGGDDSASGPEAAVQKLLDAMEKKDADAFFEALDPATLEEFTSMGLSEDDAKTMFAGELFTYESMKFSGVEMETKSTSDTTATVTIVKGTSTITEDGETTSEDVRDSDTPVSFECVKVDGKWYVSPETFF